ncbi:hypothetical protein BDN72DRAFT_845867 [Pluteus cervinus]|uniref:Uncharacterized protein n=1 Tax=Pluteus cervinus TaxID=181527 RepID=A0ACD3AIG2_9AGAR|nr:hypothetical protein BDN72DRAFT_845867 [Pluteus cervinus]
MEPPTEPLEFFDPHFHERTEVEKEILVIQRRLQDLRALRNSLLPIFTLPSDVLSQILEAVVIEPRRINPFMLRLLTHVCRQWREIVIGIPTLWVELKLFLSDRWFSRHLERSKEVALSVTFDSTESSPGRVQLLVSQFHRVSNLELRNYYLDEDENPILITAAPMLRSLVIEKAVIPQTLFFGVAPLLRNVDLEHCQGFRLSALPSNLTTLRLFNLNPKLSVVDCLTSLSSFHHLQVLHLHSTLEESLDQVEPDLKHLPPSILPELHSLVLEDVQISAAIKLLARIYISDKLAIRLSLSNRYSGDDQGYIQAYAKLTSRFQDFGYTRKIQLTVFRTSSFELVSTPPNGIAAQRILTTRPLHYTLISQMLERVSLESFHSLKLCRWLPTEESSMWISWSSQLPGLQDLDILGEGATSFMTHLVTTTQVQPPFPALRRLVLRDFIPRNLPSHHVIDAFCELLKSRKASGVGVEELLLVGVTNLPVDKLALCTTKLEQEAS